MFWCYVTVEVPDFAYLVFVRLLCFLFLNQCQLNRYRVNIHRLLQLSVLCLYRHIRKPVLKVTGFLCRFMRFFNCDDSVSFVNEPDFIHSYIIYNLARTISFSACHLCFWDMPLDAQPDLFLFFWLIAPGAFPHVRTHNSQHATHDQFAPDCAFREFCFKGGDGIRNMLKKRKECCRCEKCTFNLLEYLHVSFCRCITCAGFPNIIPHTEITHISTFLNFSL